MTKTRTVLASALTLAAGLMVFAALSTGCQSEPKAEASEQPNGKVDVELASAELSGAQLWAQTCAHCHNSRSPASYSDANWDVAMNHMRQQAQLTGGQARKIVEFLKASN